MIVSLGLASGLSRHYATTTNSRVASTSASTPGSAVSDQSKVTLLVSTASQATVPTHPRHLHDRQCNDINGTVRTTQAAVCHSSDGHQQNGRPPCVALQLLPRIMPTTDRRTHAMSTSACIRWELVRTATKGNHLPITLAKGTDQTTATRTSVRP